MLTKALAALALIVLTATACADEDEGEPSPPAGTPTPSPAGEPVAFETLSEGINSGVVIEGPGAETIRTPAEWQDFWQRHRSNIEPTTAPPAFDFGSRMIVALVDQDQPTGGYSIQITGIFAGDRITVRALRTIPGRGCIVTQAFTQPFHIVALDAIAGEVVLEVSEQVNNCD